MVDMTASVTFDNEVALDVSDIDIAGTVALDDYVPLALGDSDLARAIENTQGSADVGDSKVAGRVVNPCVTANAVDAQVTR